MRIWLIMQCLSQHLSHQSYHEMPAYTFAAYVTNHLIRFYKNRDSARIFTLFKGIKGRDFRIKGIFTLFIAHNYACVRVLSCLFNEMSTEHCGSCCCSQGITRLSSTYYSPCRFIRRLLLVRSFPNAS